MLRALGCTCLSHTSLLWSNLSDCKWDVAWASEPPLHLNNFIPDMNNHPSVTAEATWLDIFAPKNSHLYWKSPVPRPRILDCATYTVAPTLQNPQLPLTKFHDQKRHPEYEMYFLLQFLLLLVLRNQWLAYAIKNADGSLAGRDEIHPYRNSCTVKTPLVIDAALEDIRQGLACGVYSSVDLVTVCLPLPWKILIIRYRRNFSPCWSVKIPSLIMLTTYKDIHWPYSRDQWRASARTWNQPWCSRNSSCLGPGTGSGKNSWVSWGRL